LKKNKIIRYKKDNLNKKSIIKNNKTTKKGINILETIEEKNEEKIYEKNNKEKKIFSNR